MPMPTDPTQFRAELHAFKDDIDRRSKGPCPRYSQGGQDNLAIYDQEFDYDIEPAGIVNCRQALRVGSTNNALDVLLVASQTNETDLLIPAGATITLTLMQGDKEEGTFEPVGGSICIAAPNGGMAIQPGERIFRFPIGNFAKPWLMVTLEFSGAITGGTCECRLGYMPR